MDETKTRWFAWIARHSQFVVPFLIGAFAGAFLLVLTGATQPITGVTGAAFLATITAVAAATVSIVSAWALAGRTDAIKRRRKTNVCRVRMRALLREYANAKRLMERAAERSGWDDSHAFEGGVMVQELARAAEVIPDFDELLDNELDIEHADKVVRTFQYARRRFSVPEGLSNFEKPKLLELVRERFGGHSYRVATISANVLASAEQHFAAKIRAADEG